MTPTYQISHVFLLELLIHLVISSQLALYVSLTPPILDPCEEKKEVNDDIQQINKNSNSETRVLTLYPINKSQ